MTDEPMISVECSVCGATVIGTREQDEAARRVAHAAGIPRGSKLYAVCDPCWQETRAMCEAMGGNMDDMLRTGPSYWRGRRLRGIGGGN